MQRKSTGTSFRYFMHDGPAAFSFELAGSLSDSAARELRQVWRTASSIIAGRALVIDLSFVTSIEAAGRELLHDWTKAGAQFVASSDAARRLLYSITGQMAAPVNEKSRRQTWFPFQTAARAAVALILLLSVGTLRAADLKQETLRSWQDYVDAATLKMQERAAPDKTFLAVDETPGRSAAVRAGEILVGPASSRIPLKVPAGLIHDWTGSAFIPNSTAMEVLRVVRDYGRYREIYRPAVIDSRAIAEGEQEDRFSMLLMNKSLVSKTALASDYRASYVRVDERRWYSIAVTERVQEIAGYGSGSQRVLPEDSGTGLIWRAMSITRFEERDGGVYVEIEALVLSRDVPAALRWMVDPIIRRVSRDSLTLSLKQTQDAVAYARNSTRMITRSASPFGMEASGSAVKSFHP